MQCWQYKRLRELNVKWIEIGKIIQRNEMFLQHIYMYHEFHWSITHINNLVTYLCSLWFVWNMIVFCNLRRKCICVCYFPLYEKYLTKVYQLISLQTTKAYRAHSRHCKKDRPYLAILLSYVLRAMYSWLGKGITWLSNTHHLR